MAAAPDLSQIPPSDIPDALQDGIAKLSAPLKQLLMMKSVPYLIQHRLGSENYVTVEDLADRWDSAQVARQQGPRELGFEADHNGFTAASSGFAAMKLFQVVRAAKEMIQTHPSVLATPGPGPSRPLSLTEVLCVNVPNLRRNFQPNGASQNHNTGTRGVMLSCVASTSFAAKARLVSFTPSTSSVPFRKKGRDPSRPVRRSQWTAGRRKKRRKNGQHQPHGASWSDCTWYSGTPCWCVWLPSPSFLNSTWRRKTLTLSMIGSMDLSWGAVGLPPRSRRCSWQSAMHGKSCISRCMVACISKKVLRRSKTTACSGWEKSMKESSPKGPKVNQRKAKTRRAHGGTPSANRSGRRKERAMETKVAKEKGKGSQNLRLAVELGFQESKGGSLLPRLFHQEDLPRPVWTFSQLSSGELWRLGLQCGTQGAQARELPSQGLKGSDGCQWRCGASWKPRGKQRHPGWHWCSRHTSIHHGLWQRTTRNWAGPR